MGRKKKVVEEVIVSAEESPKEVVKKEDGRIFQIGDRVRILGEPRGFEVTGKIMNYNLLTKAYRVNGISTERSVKGVVLSSASISKVFSADALELIVE